MQKDIRTLATRILEGRNATHSDLLALLPLLPSEFPGILLTAHLAAQIGAPAPFSCGIVNIKSGNCQENCAFCAQSVFHGSNAPTFPLIQLDSMRFHVERLAAAGVTYVGMVASGRKPSENDLDALCNAARIIARDSDVKLCASLGILEPDQAQALRDAGFTSYHHNLETSRSFFPSVCSTHDYDSRVRTIVNAAQAGLRVCSGGIFGIGETWEQRLEFARDLSELPIDSIPVNFLAPIPGTPLEHRSPLGPKEALAIIAFIRLMHPYKDIVICGGRTHCLGEFDSLIGTAGANGLMIGDYLTVKGKPLERDAAILELMGVL